MDRSQLVSNCPDCMLIEVGSENVNPGFVLLGTLKKGPKS
jgi:hypothetical protein